MFLERVLKCLLQHLTNLAHFYNSTSDEIISVSVLLVLLPLLLVQHACAQNCAQAKMFRSRRIAIESAK